MHDTDERDFSPGFIIRLQYACYLFVAMLATMLFRGLIANLFVRIPFLHVGCMVLDPDANPTLRRDCVSEMVIYRVSFALAVFYGLHWISVSDLTCCVRSSARAELQGRFFYVKSLCLALLVVLTFFLPNSFFALYGYACVLASALFILLNVVFLVDFAYQWSDDWGERAEGNEKWMWYLFAITLGSFALGILIEGLVVYWYVAHPDCDLNAFLITSVTVGGLVYTVLSIWVPHGSIVPSSLIFLYTSATVALALRMVPDAYCTRSGSPEARAGGGGPTSMKGILFGSLMTSFTLVYTVVSSGGSGAALNVGLDADQDEEEDPDVSGHLSHYMFFYFIMMLGSMYLAMLATDWRVSGAGEATFLASVNMSFWVRIVTVWMAILLYIWSLVAPYTCCKERDFGFAVEEDWL